MKIEKAGIEALPSEALLSRGQVRYVLIGSASDSYIDKLMRSEYAEEFCGERCISPKNLLLAIEEREKTPRGRPVGSKNKPKE